jgi:conjugal transfer pilus assembly protein TraE
MRQDEYRLELDKSRFRAKKEATINVMLTIALLIESFVILALYGSQRTIVLPPKISEPFFVHDNEVSAPYLTDFAEFIAIKSMNLTPKNALRELTTLLPYAASEDHDRIRADFETMAAFIVENDITQAFYPSDVENKDGKLLIRGVRQRFVGGKSIESVKTTLEIGYRIRSGKFEFTELGAQK